MRTRPLLITALVALAAGAAHAWPTTPPRPDPAPTLDQLIDRLAEVRAKEAELQARRADLERQVRDRLDEQARRLQQVGVSLEGAGRAVPGVDLVSPPLHMGTLPGASLDPFGSSLPIITSPAPAPSPPPPAELWDRFDALGGLPIAYTRQWRQWRETISRGTPEVQLSIVPGLFGGN